ncbi:MAG: hypothetical protein GY922_11300 [Proteobacteria bacterium]|nr:hypothetical protein [Pseudomonadota bacterium]
MENNSSTFTDVDLTLEDYRPFSMLALMSLLASLFSGFVALVNPNMLAGSVASAILASFALILLHSKKQKISGYRLAVFALFISLFAGSASVAYQQFFLRHKTNTARVLANEWLELAKQGRMHELYQMTLDNNDRAEAGTNLVEEYGTLTSPGPELQLYLKQEPELSLRADGDQARLTHIGTSHEEIEIYKQRFIVRYKYERPNGETRLFSITMTRLDYPLPVGPHWYVLGITNDSPKIPRQLTQEQMGGETMPEDML